jgi:hypothetical protein
LSVFSGNTTSTRSSRLSLPAFEQLGRQDNNPRLDCIAARVGTDRTLILEVPIAGEIPAGPKVKPPTKVRADSNCESFAIGGADPAPPTTSGRNRLSS